MVLVLGIVKASLEILGIGIGVKKSGIAHVCFTGYSNTFCFSHMSSYARLQSFNWDCMQITGQINLKLVRVTRTGLEVLKEVSWIFSIWGSKSNKPQNQRLPYELVEFKTVALQSLFKKCLPDLYLFSPHSGNETAKKSDFEVVLQRSKVFSVTILVKMCWEVMHWPIIIGSYQTPTTKIGIIFCLQFHVKAFTLQCWIEATWLLFGTLTPIIACRM